MKFRYEGGREGDHAVTVCQEKDGKLIVQRVDLVTAQTIEGYQCEKTPGTYPLSLPQVGSNLDILLALGLSLIMTKLVFGYK